MANTARGEHKIKGDEEYYSLLAHFTAQQINVHSKKQHKGTDFYMGVKAQQAAEEEKRKNQEAAEWAKRAFHGKTFKRSEKLSRK